LSVDERKRVEADLDQIGAVVLDTEQHVHEIRDVEDPRTIERLAERDDRADQIQGSTPS